jgi:hypothetical protein
MSECALELRITRAQGGMPSIDVLKHIELVSLLLGRKLLLQQIFNRFAFDIVDLHSRVSESCQEKDTNQVWDAFCFF